MPLTGAQLARLPRYRLLQPVTADDLDDPTGRKAEAEAWRALYAEDYRLNIAVGQMHEHRDTCFKYVVDKTVRVARCCRFNFCHFVQLVQSVFNEAFGKRIRRRVTLARTGKDLVLPRAPGQAAPLLRADAREDAGLPVELKPTRELGPTVECCADHGKDGTVRPIRWNCLEGSSNGPMQVSIQGNADFQNMFRTMHDGFNPDARDLLRTSPTEPELRADQEAARERFEAALPERVKTTQRERKRRGSDDSPDDVIEDDLRRAWEKRCCETSRGGFKHRFKRWAKGMVAEGMKVSLQVMFYACDYSTKPNMNARRCWWPFATALRGWRRRCKRSGKRR